LVLNLVSGAGDEPVIAGALEKWESRALSGISSEREKTVFGYP
jgi:hypothetical protein